MDTSAAITSNPPSVTASMTGVLSLDSPFFGAFKFTKSLVVSGMELTAIEPATGHDITVDLATPAGTVKNKVATLAAGSNFQRTIFATPFTAADGINWQFKLTGIGSTYAGSDLRVRLLCSYFSPVPTDTWVTVADSDVLAVLNAAYRDKANQLGTDATTRLPSLRPMVVAACRGDIQQGQRVPLSLTSATIPPETKLHCVYRIVASLQSAAPGLDLTKDQEKLIQEAKDYWKDIREGKILVVRPADPDPDFVSSVAWGSKTQLDMTSDGL